MFQIIIGALLGATFTALVTLATVPSAALNTAVLWAAMSAFAILAVVLSGIYGILRLGKRRVWRETIARLSDLLKEADGLKIIWATDKSADEACGEAVIWARKTIVEIHRRLGPIADQQVRMKAELPLQGEIKDADFEIEKSYSKHSSEALKLSLIRERHYDVYYWLRDFIASALPTPDMAWRWPQ